MSTTTTMPCYSIELCATGCLFLLAISRPSTSFHIYLS